MSTLFKNIAGAANGLLADKIAGGAKNFSITTKTGNGVTYSASANANGADVSGKIGASFSTDSGFSVNQLELDNKGTLSSNITLDKAVDKVQFSINAKIQPLKESNPAEETKIGAVYTANDFKGDLVVSPFDPTSADASLCFARNGLLVGGSAGFKYDDCGNFDLSNYEFGAAYSKGSGTGALVVKNKLSDFQFSFHHQHSDAIAFAATIDGSLAANTGAALAFGGSYNVDADTTAFSKLNVPNDGNSASSNFSFHVAHKLNSQTSLGLTAVLPVDLSGAPQLGLSLSFGN